MNEEKNVLIIEKIYHAFARGELETILGLLSDDVDWFVPGPEDIPYSGRYPNKEKVKWFFQILIQTTTVEQFEAKEFFARGERIVVLGYERIRVNATGRAFENDWVHIWTLKDGKVIQFREALDTATMVQAFRNDSPRRIVLNKKRI